MVTDIKTPIGILRIYEQKNSIIKTEWTRRIVYNNTQESKILRRTKKQFMEYFFEGRKSFDIAITYEGSDFQRKIWEACLNVPYGKTTTYKQLAKAAGYPKAIRAVGTALSKNHIPIIIPCHRIIKSDGTIGKYSGGDGIKTKQFLLSLEGCNI